MHSHRASRWNVPRGSCACAVPRAQGDERAVTRATTDGRIRRPGGPAAGDNKGNPGAQAGPLSWPLPSAPPAAAPAPAAGVARTQPAPPRGPVGGAPSSPPVLLSPRPPVSHPRDSLASLLPPTSRPAPAGLAVSVWVGSLAWGRGPWLVGDLVHTRSRVAPAQSRAPGWKPTARNGPRLVPPCRPECRA